MFSLIFYIKYYNLDPSIFQNITRKKSWTTMLYILYFKNYIGQPFLYILLWAASIKGDCSSPSLFPPISCQRCGRSRFSCPILSNPSCTHATYTYGDILLRQIELLQLTAKCAIREWTTEHKMLLRKRGDIICSGWCWCYFQLNAKRLYLLYGKCVLWPI